MKQTLYFIGLLVLTISCSNESEESLEKIKLEWSKYNNAMSVNDYQVAKSSVYNILALDSNNHTYYDTLTKLYFLSKEYKSASTCAAKALAFKVTEPTLDLAYNCAKALKNNEDVLLYGESLLDFQPDSISLKYELAFNYIQLMDLVAGEELLNEIILSPKSLTEEYAEFRGNGVQKIPYRAAAYNLRGFIFNEKQDMENALGMFNAALMVKKDYVLAQENYDALTAELATADSTSHSSQ
jgi:tetratricopeptide (TPR) repeat protein